MNLVPRKPSGYELCGFCDASLKAYAAVVYLQREGETGCNVDFVASKRQVAPLKRQTIPRLEPLFALVLARLMPASPKPSRMKYKSHSLAVSQTRQWHCTGYLESIGLQAVCAEQDVCRSEDCFHQNFGCTVQERTTLQTALRWTLVSIL